MTIEPIFADEVRTEKDILSFAKRECEGRANFWGDYFSVAICNACNWTCQDYLAAQKKAREHAKIYGHHVTVETGHVIEYNKPKDHQ